MRSRYLISDTKCITEWDTVLHSRKWDVSKTHFERACQGQWNTPRPHRLTPNYVDHLRSWLANSLGIRSSWRQFQVRTVHWPTIKRSDQKDSDITRYSTISCQRGVKRLTFKVPFVYHGRYSSNCGLFGQRTATGNLIYDRIFTMTS